MPVLVPVVVLVSAVELVLGGSDLDGATVVEHNNDRATLQC